MTFDVLAPGPSGIGSFTDGTTIAVDNEGWVRSDFTIQWGSNIFNPGPVAEPSSFYSWTEVSNDRAGIDRLIAQEQYGSDIADSSAELLRASSDLSWLGSLAFDTSVGLAPDGVNQISFTNRTFTSSPAVASGYFGNFNLSSMTLRTVPEPGTIALLGLGLIGVGLSRLRSRRRAA